MNNSFGCDKFRTFFFFFFTLPHFFFYYNVFIYRFPSVINSLSKLQESKEAVLLNKVKSLKKERSKLLDRTNFDKMIM